MPPDFNTVWTAEDWFNEAELAYAEKHQGCPWCESSHCVFQRQEGERSIFHCQTCDFHVSHDRPAKTFSMVPGEDLTPAPETMHDWSLSRRD